MTLEKNFFRKVMGHFLTGVTVVTTASQGQVTGLTVNAFCSVSLDPPLVLVCIDLKSNTLPLFRESKTFAVNILTDKQEHLSRCFSTHSPDRYEHFCHVTYHTAATGAPIIDDALAFIDARIVAEYPGGDHAIFLGQVEALGAGGKAAFADEINRVNSTLLEPLDLSEDEAHPLAFYRAEYRHLAARYHKASQSPSPQQNSTHDQPLERQIG
ncbi:MAG: flavin reductase family protein [Ktedonobacteraceae bacterium]|nr:flavin reductase family protein [Ktedonobacteraceae bacterium]